MAQATDDRDADVPSVHVAGTVQVLLDEYRILWPDDPDPPNDEAGYLKRVNAMEGAALCLSGGGLGSAAFSLGVLQALSRRRLLTGFHYLSTVSGGGYAGGWLQRWIHADGDASRVMAKLGDLEEPPEVTALRPGSASPGSPSGDRWHTAALLLRNTTVYWLILGPALLLLALIPNLFLVFVAWSHEAVLRSPWLVSTYLGIAAAAIAVSTYLWLRLLPSYRNSDFAGTLLEKSPAFRVIAPMLCWALVAIPAISVYSGVEWHGDRFAIVTAAGMVAGLMAALARLAAPRRRTLLRDIPAWVVSFAAVAALVAALMRLIAGYQPDPFGFGLRIIGGFGMVTGLFDLGDDFSSSGGIDSLTLDLHYASFVVLGPLGLMLAQLLGTHVFVAFRRAAAFAQPDADREWMARLSAAQLKLMLLWSFVGFAALLLSTGINRYAPVIDLPDVIVIAISSCAIALIASDQSEQATWSGILGFIVRFIPLRFISAVATFVFIASVILVANQFTAILWNFLSDLSKVWIPSRLLRLLATGFALALTFALAALLVGSRVAMNRFSFTELHRDRLTRMFLGCARTTRNPDPFVDFDPSDNVRLDALAPTSLLGRRVLYPVLNASLDVARSHSEERTRESFIFSPLYSGASALACRRAVHPRPTGAFIASRDYADDEVNLGMDGSGITLATAMAISGADAGAVGSRVTSSSLNLIMTVLNLRAVARLPNPARAETLGSEVRSWPSASLWSVLRDLAGATRLDELDIRVADGGRFDALGLYEMIRRRCRFILAIDATVDPELSFASLGNAIRKVKIDFGVEIQFRGPGEMSRPDPSGKTRQAAWSVAKIIYPEGPHGALLYLKATVLGSDLPVDVASYAAGNRLFPHENTSGFSISEGQFESHRRLGESLLTGIGQELRPHLVADWFADAERQAQGGGEIVSLLYEAIERSKAPGAASARNT